MYLLTHLYIYLSVNGNSRGIDFLWVRTPSQSHALAAAAAAAAAIGVALSFQFEGTGQLVSSNLTLENRSYV